MSRRLGPDADELDGRLKSKSTLVMWKPVLFSAQPEVVSHFKGGSVYSVRNLP